MCRSIVTPGSAERPLVKFSDRRGEVVGRLVEVTDFVVSIRVHGRGVVHCWLGGPFNLERIDA